MNFFEPSHIILFGLLMLVALIALVVRTDRTSKARARIQNQPPHRPDSRGGNR